MIRQASREDARLAAQLLHDFNSEFDEPTPAVDVLTQRLERLVARDDVVVLLAGEEGLAFLTFRPGVWDEGPVALLEELYVRPERRNQGLGSALLERSFDVARERGCETYQVNVDESDVDAQRFYERHGVAARQPNGERAFYFERTL